MLMSSCRMRDVLRAAGGTGGNVPAARQARGLGAHYAMLQMREASGSSLPPQEGRD